MAGQDDDADKTQEPTQHKLDEARKNGDLARSADLNTAASYAGCLIAAVAAGAGSISDASGHLMLMFTRSNHLAAAIFDAGGGGGASALGGLLLGICIALLVWFALPAGMALLSVLAQRSLVVAPTKLQPKLSRINPMENAKNKFGATGLFEFAKSAVKLVLFCVLLGVYLAGRLPQIAGSLHAEPQIIGALMARMTLEFLLVVLVIALAIGAVDYLWQTYDHRRRNMMSHKEIRDEHKQNEGDPHMKQQRRQKAMQISANQMMAELPQADVVIVNPTHYAVALKWSRAPGAAPACVAKGVDHMAQAIRECAFEHGVPVHSDPPTARALHAGTEVGQEIDPSQYRAVAAAIRFADKMRRKAGHTS
ncbi:EscU/YscU/HrcU family type III secretion system export apparatus switch protein [Roseovarius tibetensis]|uniref:EscU/YscU/HrcU family type III secretion system export apparatus switch protein n=1 Tax=Roseovarius tibetensis TaxID=2685897 RepID=UPI003D7FF706